VTVPVVDAQPFSDAIKTAMTAQGITYAEGKRPASVPAGASYIVGWLDSGRVEDRSLKSRDGFSMAVVLQAYGLSPDSVRFAVRKGRSAIASLTGVTAGSRQILPPSHLTGTPMQRDDSVNPPLWWTTDEWRLRTA
jgi:hypothetical protein